MWKSALGGLRRSVFMFLVMVMAAGCGGDEPEHGDDPYAWLDALPAAGARAALTSCTAEADCGAGSGLACIGGLCQPCARHGQCDSDVCDRYAATSAGLGRCYTSDQVLYVDRAADCAVSDGSRPRPFCEPQDAVPRAVGPKFVIRVYPGTYRSILVSDRAVFVFGEQDGSSALGDEDVGGPRVTGAHGRMVLDGLRIINFNNVARCDAGAELQLRDIHSNGTLNGVRATDCLLFMDRVRINGVAFTFDLRVDGATRYRVSNSYFLGPTLSAGVIFSDASRGRFLFNTVVGTGENGGGGVSCGATPRLLEDSIVAENTTASGSQLVGACALRKVVVGSADSTTDPGAIKLDPVLNPDSTLPDSPANAACCIDQGDRYVSSLRTDFFGHPRPQGASNDIGAQEVR